MRVDGSPVARQRRVGLAPALLVLAALLAGGLALHPRNPASTVLVQESQGLRFVYHVPTGHSGLYDTRRDPECLENIAPSRPDDVRRLRTELQKRLGVRSLEELRTPGERNDHEAMRGLGYL